MMKKTIWTRVGKECNRFLKRVVLSGPSGLQEMLRGHFRQESMQGMEYCLSCLRDHGCVPATIIDGGAFVGDWTKMAKRVFPDARVIMVEAQESKRAILEEVEKNYPQSVELVHCLLGPVSKDAVPFFEMEARSSVLQELTNHPRSTVTRPMKTIDEIAAEKAVRAPVFLKLDVQGFEIEALKGAARTLQKTELIALEISTIRINEAAPIFHEVIEYLKGLGFVAYDFCNPSRPRDNVLVQVDVIFMREDSPLRASELFRDH